MENPTLKKAIIRDLLRAPASEKIGAESICLLTAFGLVTGIPVISDINPEKQPVGSIAMEIYDNYSEKFDVTSSLPGNDGYIILKNAEVISSPRTKSFNFTELIVFFDQIIGVTFGELSY